MLEIAFVQQCAPEVPPITVNALVKTESSFNPWAIGVNSGSRLASQPKSYGQAALIASELMKSGASFDLGLAQINSKNLKALGLSTQQVLDPCTNLRAMQTIFLGCYKRAKLSEKNSEKAVTMAFSCYNTGNFTSGFSNGYVNKMLSNHSYVSKFFNQPPQSTTVLASVQKPLPPLTKKEDLAQYVNNAQNQKNISLSADNDIASVQTVENLQVANNSENSVIDDKPVRVHQSWDIFKDF